MAVNTRQALPSWRDGIGIRWVLAVDHKRIGALYLGSGLVLLLVTGVSGLLLNLDLDRVQPGPFDAFAHQQLTALLATAGLFGVGLPLALGLALYLVPLMIGAREVARPAVVAAAFWTWLGGVLLMLAAPAAGDAEADSVAAPFSEQGRQFWALGLLLVCVAAAATVMPLLETIARRRAPGMTPARLPVFVQSVALFSVALAAGALVLALAAALFLIDASSADWLAFDVVALEGGHAAFYQVPNWFFANPILYALFIPVLGGVCEVVQVFTRRPLAARPLAVAGLAGIAVLAILLALFHLLADAFSDSFLRGIGIAGFVLLAPIGVVLVSWLASLRSFRPGPMMPPPILLALGTVLVLVLGTVLGFATGFPGDYNDGGLSYGNTAFFQGTLGGALVLGFLACIHYWFPKVTGRALDPRAAQAQAALSIVGSVLLVVGQTISGDALRNMLGADAPGGPTAGGVIGLIGFILIVLGGLGLLAETVKALLWGRRVGNDPWEGDTLEWFAASPPPEGNFDRLPPIESSRPIADLRARIALGRRA